jgi:hypothetical protein
MHVSRIGLIVSVLTKLLKSSFHANAENGEIFCRPQCSSVQREKCQPSCKPVYWCKKCSSGSTDLYNNSPSSQTGFPSSQTGLPTSQASYPSSQTGFPSSQVGFSSSQTGLPSGRDYFSASSITTSNAQTEAISVYSNEDYRSLNAGVNPDNENFSSQSLFNPNTGEKPESYGNTLIAETLPIQTYSSPEYSSSPGHTSSQSFSDPSSSQSISNPGVLSSQSYTSPDTSSNQELPSPGFNAHSDSRSSQSYQSATIDSPSHQSQAINIPVMVTGTYSGPAVQTPGTATAGQQAETLAGYSNQSADKARYTLPSLELPASGEDPSSEPDQKRGDEVIHSKPERNAFLSEDNSQGIVSDPAPGLDTSSLVPPLSFQIDWQPFLPEGIAIPAFNGIADRLPGWDRPPTKSLENSFEKQSTAADSIIASDETAKGEETFRNLSETVPTPTIGKKEQEFVGGDRQPPIIVVAVASPTDSLRDAIDESLSAKSESEDNNGGRDKFLLLASSSEVRGSASPGFPASWVPRGDINDVINTIPESQVL